MKTLLARKANKTDGASVLSAAHDTVSSSAANDKSQGSQSAVRFFTSFFSRNKQKTNTKF